MVKQGTPVCICPSHAESIDGFVFVKATCFLTITGIISYTICSIRVKKEKKIGERT
jgi:hypothetical protein